MTITTKTGSKNEWRRIRMAPLTSKSNRRNHGYTNALLNYGECTVNVFSVSARTRITEGRTQSARASEDDGILFRRRYPVGMDEVSIEAAPAKETRTGSCWAEGVVTAESSFSSLTMLPTSVYFLNANCRFKRKIAILATAAKRSTASQNAFSISSGRSSTPEMMWV